MDVGVKGNYNLKLVVVIYIMNTGLAIQCVKPKFDEINGKNKKGVLINRLLRRMRSNYASDYAY